MLESWTPLQRYVVSLADDSLVLSQNLCLWCSCGPTLEEDIALSNTALDYIGRARALYQYAGKQLKTSEDDLAYKRNELQYLNFQLYELPNGDFAQTMLRQILIDYFEKVFFQQLQNSKDVTLRAIAEKSVVENRYHLQRSSYWMNVLSNGTTESRQRLTNAVNDVWPYKEELFQMVDTEKKLVEQGIAVDRSTLRDDYDRLLEQQLQQWQIAIPQQKTMFIQQGGRNGQHTEHLGYLLAEMQYLQLKHPNLQW